MLLPGASLVGVPLLALAVTFAALPSQAQASHFTRACPRTSVQVMAHDHADARDICNGAQDAFSFFATHGLGCGNPIVLEIVPRLPEESGPTAVASYFERHKRILILPYLKFRKIKTWFKLPVDRDLYRSVAAHEVAHALAACNFASSRPTVEAHEYVAYVTMFATMKPDLRARALQAFPGTGFDRQARINTIIYMFDPMRFGAESYRHYLKNGNGADFLRSVLAGKALAE